MKESLNLLENKEERRPTNDIDRSQNDEQAPTNFVEWFCGSQSNPTAPQEPGDNSAESVLKATAYAILIIGIIASVIGMYILGSGWDGNPLAAFSVLCGGTAFATVIWASLMVVVNISTNIRAIKHRLQDSKESTISQSSVSPSVCEDSPSAITS